MKFIFQPAEELPPEGEEGGARLMIEEGALENPAVDAIFGLHVTSQLPTGVIGYRSGPTMASSDRFRITVRGRQTHGAMPWRGVDPIVTASQVVLGLQTFVSRQVDIAREPVVVTVGAIKGGVRENIIPDPVELRGTIGTFDEAMRDDVHERVKETAEHISSAARAGCEVCITKNYPVTVNDAELTAATLPTLERVAGSENALLIPKVTGSEDFSFFQHVVPGFFFVGITPAEQDLKTAAPNTRRSSASTKRGCRSAFAAAALLCAAIVVGAVLPLSARADENNAGSNIESSSKGAGETPSIAGPASHARVGFERIRFPGAGPRVGLVGTSYLVDIGDSGGLSIGPAVYGAISGGHGGFFSLGGELAWRQRLLGPVGVEIGVYAGGGGGGGAPSGSGLMLRPHADLVWDLGAVALGASISKVRYSGGRIDSNQIGLVVNANSDFRFVPASRLSEPTLGGGRAGLGFDRIQFVGGAYRTPAGKTLTDGESLPRTISTLGVRAEQAWGNHAFWGLEANRAGRGGVGGYAEYLGTAGIEGEAVRDVLTVGARVAVGMAGGGRVSTGGGLLVKAGVYGIVRLGNDFGLSLEGGVARAPNGNFRAAQGAVGLVWALDGPASTGAAARPSRTDFSAGAERYRAMRNDGSERALTLVALKLERYVTPNFYVTGKALSAAGGAASGYTSALVGAGWMQPLGSRVFAGAELLAGASGGGGVAGDGALVEPRAFVGVQLTPTLGLRAGAGRIKAFGGHLSTNVVDLSINLAYGVSSGH